MSDWKSCLKADPTDWLLETNNPSVRCLTLTDVLGVPIADPQARQAKSAVMDTGVVPRILAKQEAGGYWDKPEKLYVAFNAGSIGSPAIRDLMTA